MLAASLAAMVAANASAQTAAPAANANGESLGGFVLPTQPIATDCSLAANRGWSWKVDDTQRLLLEGDVRVKLSGYNFTARRAMVWINRLPLGSSVATQIAVWFEEAEEPTRRAGLGASGKNLLVTATITGSSKLAMLVSEDGPPTRRTRDEALASTDARRALLVRGEQRLAGYLRGLQSRIEAGSQRLSTRPVIDSVPPPVEEPPVVGGRIAAGTPAPPAADAVPTAKREQDPIFDPKGSVTFSSDSIVIDEKSDRVIVQGMVEIEYRSGVQSAERSLQLSAERGVLFLAKGALSKLRSGTRSIEASDVEGIYLEGAVQASDGEYALRAAQVYYDLKANRASIVDAVLRTYDRRLRDLPVSVRAAELRQVAADQWVADRANVSTSEFFTPHLAIGVDRVTVTKAPDELGGELRVEARGAALEAGGTRLIPLPGYEGSLDRLPIRSIEMGYDEDRGVELGTSWDLAALLGEAPTRGVDSELRVDGYTERGAAVGTTFRLSEEFGKGVVDLYGLYDTGGADRTSSGENVAIEPGMRGIVDADWRTALDASLTLRTQFSYISDETFVSAWRESAFDQRREYETSGELVSTSANTSTSLFVKHDLNDFISNSYLLASRGYTVDKLPEFAYHRFGDEPLEGITWTQQWSASAVALRPTTGTPALLGVPTGAWGDAIGANDSIDEAFASAGYNDGTVGRLDTRHEVSIPMSNGWANLAPFISGEATGYVGDALDSYTADIDELRLQAGGGVRGSLKLVHVDDTVQSRLLDLNRMRHIVEPYTTLWAGWDSLEAGSLPVYDQAIEGSSQGMAANFGVRQTLQTQRGGAGAWQSVDWLKLDLGLVVNDNANDFTPEPVDPGNPFSSLRWAQSPIPAFYSFRPELSQWGSHGYGASTWQLSDALTLGGTANYLFEDREFITDEGSVLPNLARASLGVEMRHNPVTSTYLEYRYLAPTSTELLQAGVLYQVGKRYLLSMSPQYDLSAGDFRAVSGAITRTFPDFDFNADAGYDLIEDRTFVGLSLSIPAGSRASGGSSSGFGAFNPAMGGRQ